MSQIPGNNCSGAVTVTVGAAPAPDLVVGTPTVSESAPIAGASFTLSATVRNQGNGPSASTTLRYYQSTDSTITTADTEAGTDYVFPLDASESGDDSVSLTAPSTPGTYYYGACVEAVSDETDTTNNCSDAVTVRAVHSPDRAALVALYNGTGGDNWPISTNWLSDQSIGTWYGVNMNSDGRVIGLDLGYRRSCFLCSSYYGNGLTGPVPAELGNLANLEEMDLSHNQLTGALPLKLTRLTGLETLEFHRNTSLCAPADPVFQNWLQGIPNKSGPNCADAPDLVVGSPTVDNSSPAADESFTLSATVLNKGSSASASTTLHYYQSGDSRITTGDTLVGTDPVSRLDAGESGADSVSLTAPSTPVTYYYGACVDSVSGESDTQNNCSSAVTVTVSATASVPNSPTGLTATANGQTRIDLSWRAPSDDGGANITGYKIEVSTDGSSWSDLVASTGSTGTSYSHTGLTAGSTRHYRVSAINSAGTGHVSNTDSATTDAPEQAEADTCATGDAVSDPANNPGLVADCEMLLAAKDTLRGTATLNWSADTPIASWDAVTVSGAPRRVTELDTAYSAVNGELTGTIPAELGSLSELTILRLSNNKSTGTIPPEFGNLTNLKWLSLWNNQLTGTIPQQLGNLSSLTMLRLEWNDLTGTIPPELGNLTSLDSMSLGGNRLTGAIPPELGNLTNLRSLSLGGSNSGENQLTGAIPTELKNLTKLQSLSIWKNRISGTIPTWLGSLTDLRTLNLAGNQFTGTIPKELGNLTKVGQFWLQDNQLTGAIPTELGNLANITELLLRNNRLTGDIPAELSSLAKLRQLLLVNNQLTGCIPEGLRNVRDNDLGRLGLPDCNASTAPGATTGLTAVADGQTQINLSWTAPSDDGGADITGYKIEVSTGGSSWSDQVADTDSNATSYSHTGLDAGSTRHYRVSAINSAGTGYPSNIADATTEAASVAKPGAPTALTATADGRTEIDLSWSAPSDDGGADITGYKIEVSTDGSDWTDLVADTSSTSTNYPHSGLAAGSTQHYRVSAINSAGTGPASNVDDATTDAAPSQESTCRANLTVGPGERCTYPGTSDDFWVGSDGKGQFLSITAGNKIEIRDSTINGVVYTFVARKQSDGNWLVEEVGDG